MSIKNLISIFIALVVVAAAAYLGGGVSAYVNPSGLILVLGGSLLGVYLAFPTATLRGIWQERRVLFTPQIMKTQDLVRTFMHLARLQRSEGVRSMEDNAAKTGNVFLEMGVALVADNLKPYEIRERLEQEFEFFLSRKEAQRAVVGLVGRLAPAFGLAGTMIGLIGMLHTIKDPTAVTEGMSVALLSTFYGLMLANLVVLPLERKLSEIVRAQAVEMTLIIEGVMGLAAADNGAAIRARISSFRLAEPATPPAAHPIQPQPRSWLRGGKSFSILSRSQSHGR